MSRSRRLFELIVLGGCAFILTKAILSYVLDAQETPTAGNPTWRLILAVSYIGMGLVLIPWYRETLVVLRRNWCLVAMLLLALLSSLWANMPDLVLRKSIGLYGASLLGIALAVRVSLSDQLRMMSWLFRAIAVLSLAFVVLFPSLAISQEGQWMGVFEYKNALGSIMGLGVLVEWQRPAGSKGAKILKILAYVLYAVLLLHSDSVTPLIALLGCVCLVESYRFATFRLRLPQYAFFVAVSIVMALGSAFIASNSDSAMGIVGRSSNLTGRTEIWALVLSFIPQKPILGYGYDGFFLGASPESFVVNHMMRGWVMYSHNGYLEQQLNLGIIGLALTFVFLGIGMWRVLKLSEHRYSKIAVWPLAFLVYFILHNIGECTIMIQDIEWALCVSCITGADALLFSFHAQTEDEMAFVPMEQPA
jgi:exopolysaccharide production protein ExoQ